VRVSTTITTYRERKQAAETAYDQMMTEGRGAVEYTEPSTGVRIRKDPAEMRAYIDYLSTQITTTSGSASTRRLAAFGRPR
jgi:hypothetical protein